MTETKDTATIDDCVHKVIGLIRALAAQGDLPRDLKTAPLRAETHLASLALDSLQRLVLLSELDETEDLYVPDDAVTEKTTIGALAALITKRRGRTP